MNIPKVRQEIEDHLRRSNKYRLDGNTNPEYSECLSNILHNCKLIKSVSLDYNRIRKYYEYLDQYISCEYYMNSWNEEYDMIHAMDSLQIERIVGYIPLFASESKDDNSWDD